MNTARKEIHQLDIRFRMILEVHDEYHQLLEDRGKQGENDVWFDRLNEQVRTFKPQSRQLV